MLWLADDLLIDDQYRLSWIFVGQATNKGTTNKSTIAINQLRLRMQSYVWNAFKNCSIPVIGQPVN